MTAEGQSLFGTPAPAAPTGPVESAAAAKGDSRGSPSDAAGGWSILIEAFAGPQAEASAREAVTRAQSTLGLDGAYPEKRGETWVLAYGHYTGPADPKAARDLARIKSTEYRGLRPLAGAYLSPEVLEGTLPEFDLRNVKKSRGRWAMYTLQIAAYGVEGAGRVKPEDMEQARAKAEEAVVDLRRQGEEAFYYHGPNRSSVTIGVFEADDVDAETHQESPRIRQLRERYPYNLFNGKGIKEFHRGIGPDGKDVVVERMSPSRIVMIPES
ncbi:MAG: hypothetical protein IT437_02710 [Phycisphaerales bacterium]|nr:hypothetical protein [Phycisphaerales bacterium]